MNTRFKENVQKLFEFWCEISPTAIGEKVSGVIVESFPERFKDPEIIGKIPEFAYPCHFLNESVQTYSFVLTSTDSKWRFGFCRHDAKAQTAMVIITYLPWHDTFLKFLNVLGELKRTAPQDFQPFIAEAYAKGVPEPGACLKLFYNGGLSSFIFQRPSQFQLPSIPQNHNLNLYYSFVNPKNMINVFAAMLAERRIIFTSQRLDRLSSSVQAAHAFLYPMVWQHIFIPILPLKMKEILCAPMPYLIGVPEAVLETMTPEELGEVVIMNCDNESFTSPFDDVKNMPAELVSQLKKQLGNPNDHIGDRVSKIFLGVLVQLIGGYRDAIKFSQGSKMSWDRETFIESRPSHLRPFLRNMMELQIFQQFIEERLEMLNTGLGFSDEFELETLRYHEKPRRRIKPFLRNVKDKTNPAVKSAVQSVKQGGRGVRTAYKDLKSKLSERNPSKSGTSRPESTASASTNSQIRINSAPNSPVFNKRPQSDLISISKSSTHRSKPAKMLQTSNSMQNNSNFTNHFNNNLTLNINGSASNEAASTAAATAAVASTTAQNGNKPFGISHSISKSPITVSSSPTSSLSSTSEMNLLQELQQHALFKLPTVDRSLKPTHNVDQMKRSSRSGSLVNTPDHQPRRTSVPAMPYIYDDNMDSGYLVACDSSTTNSTSSFDATSDLPPDVPPVPPRISNPPPRMRTEQQLIIIDTDDMADAPPPIPVARTKPKFQSNVMTKPTNLLPILETRSNTFNVHKSNGINRTPPPPPQFIEPPPKPFNHKLNMTNESNQSEESTDLIVLDSSLSLDDFDPLNDNAKRIPEVPRRSFPSSVPQSINNPNYVSPQIQPKGFSNPIYTFYQPGQSMNYTKPITTTTTTTSTTPSPNPTTREDDKELLRKYGLDRLNLIDNQLGEITLNDHTPNPFAFNSNRNLNRTIDPFLDNGTNGLKTNGDIQPKANNNWTTFD